MAATRIIEQPEIKLVDCECPIGYEELKYPATTLKGYTYEWDNIDKHFGSSSKEPCSNEDIQDKSFVRNDNISALILAYNQYATKPEQLCSMIVKIYTCPITKKIMKDPVIAGDCCSYEREAIEIWFKEIKAESPVGEDLENTLLRPNRVLKNNIEAHNKILSDYLKSKKNSVMPSDEVKRSSCNDSTEMHMACFDMQLARISYKRGMWYKEQENFPEAIKHFKACLTICSQHSQARLEIASCLVKLDQCTEALNNYDNFLELCPLAYDAREQYGIVYNILGEWEKAYKEFELLELTYGKDTRETSLLLLSQSLFRIGRYEEAEQHYKKVIDKLEPAEHKHYLNAFIGRAQALIKCSEKFFLQYKSNIDITADIVRKTSDFSQMEEKDFTSLQTNSFILEKSIKYRKEGLAIFSYVQSIKPEEIAALESCESDLKLHPHNIPVRLRYAELLSGLAHPEHACRVYDEIIVLDNKNHEARSKQKNLLNNGYRVYPFVGIFGRTETLPKLPVPSPMREAKEAKKIGIV